MPIRRKRRIFRAGPLTPSRRASGLRPTLAAGVAMVVLAVGVALFSLPTTPFGRVPPLGGTLRAAPDAVAVVDAATLRLGDQVVHLRGVAAPPRGKSCHGTGGRSFDCGGAAAQGLAELLGGHAVACRLAGRDAAGLPLGQCSAGGTDLNRAVVAGGWGRAEAGAADLARVAAAARAAGRGLWVAGAF